MSDCAMNPSTRGTQFDSTEVRRSGIGDVSPFSGLFPHPRVACTRSVPSGGAATSVRSRRGPASCSSKPKQSDAWHAGCTFADVARRIGEQRISNAIRV
jgi:hypothetical protein